MTGTAAVTGGQVLKVSYKGQQSEYIVGPECPVLGMTTAAASLLKPDGSLTSARLYTEKGGVKPPM